MSLLSEMRHHNGWTQQDIANATTVDVRTVKRWEADDDPPDRIMRLYRSLFEDPKESIQTRDGQAVPLEHVMSIVPDPLPLKGRLAPVLGSLPNNEQFTILLGGASGAGKSTVALLLAGDLADHGAVLVATSEERMRTGTIGLRAKHAGIDPDLIDVAEVATMEDLDSLLNDGDYSYVIVDSITELGIDPEEASRLFQDHPDTSFILVVQADASEKKSVGGARWRHLVDIRLWCERDENGRRIVRNLKNRFGPRVDHIALDSGKGPSLPLQRSRTRTKPNEHEAKENDMDDTYRWMVGRLEAELAESRKEIRDLRSQLIAKDDQLRDAAIKIARFEALEETEDENPRKGLGDSFDVDKMAALADRFAPLIGIVTSALVNRGSQQATPVMSPYNPYAFPMDQVIAQPPTQTSASPHGNPQVPQFDTFIPGITQ
jgi:DNA-binding XRE family transcriptional regulator/energy-coupling factor transporter ATP-binding protein EcfA2